MNEVLMESVKAALLDKLPPYIYNAKEFVPGKSTVYYSGPYWDEKEILAAVQSLLNGKWVVSGENVHKFESRFSKYFNIGFSQMVNSGSSANLAMITALKKHMGWQDNDEIIVSPVGFPTTISPLVQNNLKPVFIDIEFETLNFDLNLLIKKITPKTKGIFISPVLGNPPDMDRLVEISKEYGLMLIGDNCDSLGSKWEGKYLTDYYYCSSCSFYPAHHISTGEGGMISSNDEKFIDTVRSVAWWGRDCYCVGSANLLACGTCKNRFDKWLPDYDGIIDHKYYFTNIGYNLKPLDLQGAIGLEQLKKFEEIETNRRKNKLIVQELFRKYVPGVMPAKVLDKGDPSWFGVPIICESQAAKEKLVAFLEDNKIQTRNYFAGNLLMHPAYRHLDDYTQYPNANKALSHVFFVGCSPHYNENIFSYYESVLEKY